MKTILITLIAVTALIIAKPGYSDGGYLVTLGTSASVDTVTATSADDTSRTFLNPNNYKNIYVEFYSNSQWRTFKIEYPSMYKYRLQYNTADSTYEAQVYNDTDGWVRVPVLFYSTTQAQTITVLKKTTNSFIRFRYQL